MKDFDYLIDGEVYFDAACQSLRPRPVIDAINDYYLKHNSCGERVKYRWGRETDALVEDCRNKVLKYLKLKGRRYNVSFTLNTTYGINLILSQIDTSKFGKIITSDIEHNSPFLATMAMSERTGLPREVIEREPDGSINLAGCDFRKAVVVVNAASNFDGRTLKNLGALNKAVHKAGGILIIDAAQAMAHSAEVLRGIEVDAICFSAHKMYAPSLGVVVWNDSLNEMLLPYWLGGGMVDDVNKDSFLLSSERKDHKYTRFESGLMAWGEIVGLNAALDWLMGVPQKAWQDFHNYYDDLYEFLANSPKVHLVNNEANPTMSFYVEGIDSHLLGEALSRENIMGRTGYFCAHYYLDHILKMPPLMRFSLGLHTKGSDIEKTKKVLSKVLN
ncbi:aminotransferase class V-fold PLP-dependent enzyme [Candidatus Saccharibacteria bacterium]|nr:aminotransferase class V-fold PLP-dependent enzyme [Candidatus Saccharibacteria bacterium]